MNSKASALSLLTVLFAAPALHAQFSFEGVPIDVHAFASQGFAYSNNNNFLTMDTSNGSFAMTDGGVNISSQLTSHFRVGAQAYVRNIGQLGHGHVSLDWAYGAYRFNDWIGIRGGKMKTALGLYNDTQDMEFLYTWAMLPQSMYPLDLRSSNIAHTGGDVFGDIPLRKAGSLSYTVYAGLRTNDPAGGTYYNTADNGDPIKTFTGRMEGMDVKWNTPVPGWTFGTSFMNERENLAGNLVNTYNLPYTFVTNPQHITAVYSDYVRGKFHLDAEYRRNREVGTIVAAGTASNANFSERSWFAAISYRLTKRIEIGTYHSRYYLDAPTLVNDPNADHIFDQVATVRYDIRRWWNFKVEGHFMNGYGDIFSAHGFYTRVNPEGLKPNTDMLVLRTAFTY